MSTIRHRIGTAWQDIEIGEGWHKLRTGSMKPGDEYYVFQTRSWAPVPEEFWGHRKSFNLVRRKGKEPGGIHRQKGDWTADWWL